MKTQEVFFRLLTFWKMGVSKNIFEEKVLMKFS